MFYGCTCTGTEFGTTKLDKVNVEFAFSGSLTIHIQTICSHIEDLPDGLRSDKDQSGK